MFSPKRLLRFSLRSLLIIVTVIGIWLGGKISAARRQKEAADAFRLIGATVDYDYQLKPTPGRYGTGRHPERGVKFPNYDFDHKVEVPGPSWLRAELGDDHFRTAVAVNITQPKRNVPKSLLDQLAKLPALRQFSLQGMGSAFQDSDFAVLAQLPNLDMLVVSDCTEVKGNFLANLSNPSRLRWLNLSDCKIDEAGMEQVGKLVNLEKLMLSRTPVTDRGLAYVQNLSRLEDLQLYYTEITDAGLQNLKPMKQLKYLQISTTHVTPAGVTDLQKALPSTFINHR